MATETTPTNDEINHVILTGSNTPLGNGLTRHTGRHPQSPDHRITVVTSNAGGGRPTIRKASREYLPQQSVISLAQQRQAAVKAKADRSASNKKAQLKKKQERSAEANKNKKKK